MSDEIRSVDTLQIKQAIIDEGLYEAGMSLEDMEQIYNTLNRSKRTAGEENEYREILSQTTINCSNIELIKTKGTEEDKDKASEMDVDLNLSSEKIFTNNNENTKTKPVANRSSSTMNIEFNFDSPSNHKPITIEKQTKNIIPILYHQPFIQMLPTEKKMDIIKLYLRYEKKKILFNDTNFVDQWGKPIVYIPKEDDSIEPQIEISEPAGNVPVEPNEHNNEKFMLLRSARLVKRKNYKEIDNDDDDEWTPTEVKKSKLNVELRKSNKSPISKKNSETLSVDDTKQQEKVESDFEMSPIINKRSKLNDTTVVLNKSTPISKPSETSVKTRWISRMPGVSDRTNKLFDKLKDKEKKTENNQEKLEDSGNLSDTSNASDIFPVTKSNLQIEVTPNIKKGKAIKKKKPQPKSRKKLSLKTTNEEEQEETINSEVSTTNFYGKNKENELDASNNNKCSTSMVDCPICSQSFPSSEIEIHASRCEQYDNSEEESLCVICNSYIAKTEMDAHKFNCLKNITEDSTEKTYDKNKNNSKLGFLCDVCDTYVVDCNPFEHASNCIAAVDDR